MAWTSIEVWAAIFLFTPIGIALDTAPRLVRPAGWTGIGAHIGRAVPLTLLVAALGAFMLTAIRAETPLPLGTEAWIAVGLLSLGAVLAFVVGLPMVAFGAIGLLFIGFSVLVQFTWIPVMDGAFVVDAATLATLHIAGGLALVVATAVVQVFRRLDPSEAETAIVDWLRAEAVLPERPAPERSTTG